MRHLMTVLTLATLCSIAGCGYIGAAIARNAAPRSDRDPVPATGSGGVPTAIVTTPTGSQAQDVPINYLLIDPESNPAGISVQFRFNGGPWTAASETIGSPSEGTTGLATSPGGTAHVFVWNSFSDVGGQDGSVELRITPSDPGPPVQSGVAGSAVFPLVNRTIATVAGGTSGVLAFPGAVIADANGNLVIADTFNHRVQVLNTQTGSIIVAGVTIAMNQLGVIAGTGSSGFNGDNQVSTSAQLNFPSGVAVDGGGHIYIADSLNHRIRRVDFTTGFITTVAGTGNAGTAGDNGLATTAELNTPRGVAFDANGNLFIADTDNMALRVVNNQSTTITIPPGGPSGVTVAPNFLRLFAGALGNPGVGGDGAPATGSNLDGPWSLAFDSVGHLYVADSDNHVVRCVNMQTTSHTVGAVTIAAGEIDTVAGNIGSRGFGGDGSGATSALVNMDTPKGVTLDGNDNLFIADSTNDRVRCVNTQGTAITVAGVSIASGNIDTIAGGGATPGPNDGDGAAATSAALRAPEGLFGLSSGDVAIADTGLGRIRVVNVGTGGLTVAGVTIAASNIDTVAGTVSASAAILTPSGVARSGNLVFVADTASHRVWQVDLTTGLTSAFAGTGKAGQSGDAAAATLARLRSPKGLALDANGNLYIIQAGNNTNQSDRVRVVNRQATSQTFHGVSIAPGNIDLVAAGAGLNRFADSPGIAVDASGNLYVAHRGGHRIMLVNSSGTISALIGGSVGYVDGALGSAQLDAPEGVAVDGSGNLLIADTGNHAIRYANQGVSSTTVCGVVVGAGSVGTVAGDPPLTGPTQGYNGDNQVGTSTLLDAPSHAVRVPGSGDILFADRGNQRVRHILQTAVVSPPTAAGIVSTLAGTGTGGYNGDGIPPVNAHLQSPTFLFLDGSTPANLFFSDAANRRVRRIVP